MKPEGLVHLAFIFVKQGLETGNRVPKSSSVDAMLGPQT
jgi:hypothetical protein